MDALQSCNKGYYSKGTLILDRKKIIKKYLKKSFFFDLFSSTPLIVGYFIE